MDGGGLRKDPCRVGGDALAMETEGHTAADHGTPQPWPVSWSRRERDSVASAAR